MLRNADGGGVGDNFSGKKRYEGVYGSTLLICVTRGWVGGGPIVRKKALPNTWKAPQSFPKEHIQQLEQLQLREVGAKHTSHSWWVTG